MQKYITRYIGRAKAMRYRFSRLTTADRDSRLCQDVREEGIEPERRLDAAGDQVS